MSLFEGRFKAFSNITLKGEPAVMEANLKRPEQQKGLRHRAKKQKLKMRVAEIKNRKG